MNDIIWVASASAALSAMWWIVAVNADYFNLSNLEKFSRVTFWTQLLLTTVLFAVGFFTQAFINS